MGLRAKPDPSTARWIQARDGIEAYYATMEVNWLIGTAGMLTMPTSPFMAQFFAARHTVCRAPTIQTFGVEAHGGTSGGETRVGTMVSYPKASTCPYLTGVRIEA